jgi:hypothetical protein
MSSRATEGRQIAVHGFLLLVQSIHANPTATSSTGSTDSSILEILGMLDLIFIDETRIWWMIIAENLSSNPSMLIGLLRRCFSQQSEVRLLVYENLSKISIEHPELASDILAMLQLQVRKLLFCYRWLKRSIHLLSTPAVQQIFCRRPVVW